MTETNNYEKAKEDCWREWTYDASTGMSLSELAEARRVFNFAFDRAYQLGKAYTQPVNGLTNERLQVAAMAMQGILSNECLITMNDERVNKSPENVAIAAIKYADALLTKFNKEKP